MTTALTPWTAPRCAHSPPYPLAAHSNHMSPELTVYIVPSCSGHWWVCMMARKQQLCSLIIGLWCMQIWPEDQFPMRKVGQLVLDTPVSNVFNEVEQIAFSPAAFVPGMALSDDHWVVTGQRHLLASLCCSPDSNPALPKAQQHLLACSLASPASCLSCASHHHCAMALDADGKSLCAGITSSDDKLLQSRLHAYADAQRYRIGVNYLTLPVNEPKCPFHQNANEGAMQFTDKDEEVCHLLTLHNTLCTLCSCPAMLQQLRRPVIAFTLGTAVPLRCCSQACHHQVWGHVNAQHGC